MNLKVPTVRRAKRKMRAMRIIDITQELFSGKVYPGDKPPALTVIRSGGSSLSNFECCTHNGTHIDAPRHFIENGGDAESIPLEKCMGICAVTTNAADATEAAKQYKKIILRGSITTAQAQKLTALDLIGTDSQTIGDPDVHRLLLSRGVVILEGLDLSSAPDGIYTLIALPMRLRASDGAPVRAVLLKD